MGDIGKSQAAAARPDSGVANGDGQVELYKRQKILDDDQVSIRAAKAAISDGQTAVEKSFALARKRGLAWSWNDTAPEVCLYHDATTARKINWLFNFSLSPPEGLPHGIHYVPQVRNATDAPLISEKLRLLPAVTHLVGFQDPDTASEVNLPVKEAVSLWKQFVLPAKAEFDIRLGSPGTSSDPEGQVWLQYFFNLLNGLDAVDFIVVHWYGNDVYALKTYLADMYEKFHKPLWLTEFAYSHTDNTIGAMAASAMNEVEEFMREAIPFLDRCPYVERYAYSGAMHFVDFKEDASGADDNELELTKAGKLYNEL